MSNITSNRSALYWLLAILLAGLMGVAVALATRQSPNTAAMIVFALAVPFALLLVPDIEKVGIAIVLLDIPLQMDTYLGYDQSQAIYSATSGFNFSITTLALVLLYGHWALTYLGRWAARKPTGDERAGSFAPLKDNKLLQFALLLPLVYIGFAVLSYTVAPDPMRVTYELCILVQSYLAVLYVLTHVRTRQDVLFICGMLMLGLCLAGLISSGLRVVGQGFNIGFLKGRVDNDWQGLRVGGTVGSPNSSAGYFTFAMSLAGGLLLAKVSRWLKVISVGGLVFGGIGLIVSLSRGGWITLAIAIAVLLAIGLYRRLVSPKVAVIIVAAVAGITFIFQDAIVTRLTEDDRGSAEARVPLNNMAWNMIQDHPFLGVGLNNYDLVMQDYITPDMTGEWVFIVHNRYLLLWSETGIASVVAFVGVVLLGMVGGWRAIRTKDATLAPIALGAFAGCCGILFHLSVDIFNGRNITEMLWLVAGLQMILQAYVNPVQVQSTESDEESDAVKLKLA